MTPVNLASFKTRGEGAILLKTWEGRRKRETRFKLKGPFSNTNPSFYKWGNRPGQRGRAVQGPSSNVELGQVPRRIGSGEGSPGSI